jgi:hypothetical protein
MRSRIHVSTQVSQSSQKWLRASIRAIDGSGLRAGAAALLPTLLKVCKCVLLSLVVGSSLSAVIAALMTDSQVWGSRSHCLQTRCKNFKVFDNLVWLQ